MCVMASAVDMRHGVAGKWKEIGQRPLTTHAGYTGTGPPACDSQRLVTPNVNSMQQKNTPRVGTSVRLGKSVHDDVMKHR